MYEHRARSHGRTSTHNKDTHVHSAENNARPFLLYDRARFDGQLLSKQALVHEDSPQTFIIFPPSHVTSICILLLVIIFCFRISSTSSSESMEIVFLFWRIEFRSSFHSRLSSVYEGKGLRSVGDESVFSVSSSGDRRSVCRLFCFLACDCYLDCDVEVVDDYDAFDDDGYDVSDDDDDDVDGDEACLSKEVGSIQLPEMNIFSLLTEMNA